MLGILFRFVVAILSRLPRPIQRALARLLGRIGFTFASRRRRIALENVAAALPELNNAQKRRLVLDSLTSLAMTAFEFVSMPRQKGRLLERVEVEGEENLPALLNSPQGAILLVAHLGNWEMGGAVLVERGLKLNVIAQTQQVDFAEELIQFIRKTMGMRVIPKKRALIESVRVLRRGEALAMLIDQHNKRDGLSVTFFGRSAWTVASPAVLSLRTGCPVFPAFLVRNKDGTFRGHLDAPIHPEPTGNFDEDTLRLTQQYTDIVEKYIRRYPNQWMWVHRRWRRENPNRSNSKPNRTSRGVKR